MDSGNKQTESVTAIGNAWIICQSKSRPGFIYYFNTVTGAAVWNVSDAEIEKAKSRTKILESQSGSKIDKYPEPNEPPIDVLSCIPQKNLRISIIPPQIRENKQTVNILPEQSQMSFISDQISLPSKRVPKSPKFHGNVWAVPSSSQVPNNMFQPSISLPITNQYETTNHHWNTSSIGGPSKFYQEPYHKFGWKNRNFMSRITSKHQNPVDLRLKLCSKRKKMHNSISSDEVVDNDIWSKYEEVQLIAPSNEEIRDFSTCDKDSNSSNSPSKLCLKPLKNLAKPEANPGSWFIVPDTGVIMDDLDYLIMLIKADKHCTLLVPQLVMMNLQAIAFSNEDSKFRARNAIRLLTQEFDAGSAEIGSPETSVIENKESAHVFNCCRTLTEQRFHVILISNSKDMLRFKYTTPIPIFTLEEVKNLLSIEHFPQSYESKATTWKPFVLPSMSFKGESILNKTERNITMDNDLTLSNEAKHNFELDSCKSKNTNQSDDIHIEPSCESDGRIQSNMLGSANKSDHNEYSTNTTTPLSSHHCMNTLSISNKDTTDSACRRRVIRLKRNISSQQSNADPTNAATGEKHFRWRRKQNTSQTTPISVKKNEVGAGTDIAQDNNITLPCKSEVLPKIQSADNVAEEYKLSDINNDGNTEGSESNCSIKKNVADKIVIEETSTSGAISNTESNVDSESIISVKPKLLGISQQKDVSKMFEISNPSMEEYLDTRRDEWIFRFDQIMEDVLTEILHQEPRFLDNKWPPPWNLTEATQCIGIKFKSYPHIVEAVNKFSNVLLKISNIHGGINKHVKPSEYMVMYSYGVHLITALQEVCNCDDLKGACESLNKLLNDIQDPIQDSGHNDTFTDIRDSSHSKSTEEVGNKCIDDEDIEVQNKTIDKDIEVQNTSIDKEDVKSLKDTASVTSRYNLRSNKSLTEKKEEEKKEEPLQVKFVRKIDIEYSFFQTLKLAKTVIDKGIVAEEEEDDYSSKVATNSELNYYDNEQLDCEFEEDKYYSEDEYDDHPMETEETQGECNESENSRVNRDMENDQKIKYFIGSFLKQIREIFLSVHEICEKYYNDLKSHQLAETKKVEMRQKAGQAQSYMEALCESLNSIIQREKNAECKIQNLMKITDIDFVLDDNMSLEYRNIIAKCKDQAESVLSSIRLILSTILL